MGAFMENIRVASDCTRVYVGGIHWGAALDSARGLKERTLLQDKNREAVLVSAFGDVLHGIGLVSVIIQLKS